MPYLTFTIEGKPIASARPRFSKFGRAYLPKATKEAKAKVCKIAHSENQNRPPIEQPVSVVMTFYFAPPKHLYKKRMSRQVRPKKPDIDNLIKTVLDGLSQAKVFKDDNLVVDISAQKLYSNDNTDERTEVTLQLLGG